MVVVASKRDIADAAKLLRGLLALVEDGKLDASSAHGTAMLRRLEGAVIALEKSLSQRS
jgi:hypothetical protein